MSILSYFLIWICCGLIVLMKSYESNENRWDGEMIPLFLFSPIVLAFRIIDQTFFNKWRRI